MLPPRREIRPLMVYGLTNEHRSITATGEGNHIDGILVISAIHWTPPQVDALAARLRNVEREPLDL